MKFSKYILLVVCLSFMAFNTIENMEPTPKYKCMVQLKNYKGEGAYVVVSVINKNNKYLKTVHILGEDEKWYPDMPTWWAFFENAKKPNVDAITGATIAGGERSIFTFQLNENDLKTGNKLRFETAVEHQDYYEKDLEISLENKNLKNKFEGTGYIRYVSIIPN
ncbi:uncharacterized protein DUF2271 [Mariniflexile fucanivorans]|uniref:Uncharacterized protein DUF2271 n=1 Tax=Mariniflexile fucanivorans TaxID=264023 RepID=A0A4R1RDI3_9FLAO|nr:DUF2271 domain-containing protein [Mariniflexile fucanivorans]TCL63592.1 uncharacterized protein DUF2271 [Mariniflexile fucanivorans]